MTAPVPRNAELAALCDQLHGDLPSAVAVVGGYGMGKTWLLRQLRETVRRDMSDSFVLPVNDAFTAHPFGLGGGHLTKTGDEIRTDALRLRFDRSVALLKDLVAGLEHHFVRFTEATDQARSLANRAAFNVQNTLNVGWRGRAEDVRMDVSLTDVSAYLRNQLQAAQEIVDEGFVKDWADWAKDRRVLLTLDGFESLADDIVGQWFTALSRRLRNTLVGVAVAPAAAQGPVVTIGRSLDLPKFSRQEVSAYLTSRFGAAVTPDLVSVVHEFTGGHPFGVNITATFISTREDESLDPDRLRRSLARLPADPGTAVADLVQEVTGSDENSRLRRAVLAASAVHFFDAPLLAQLLERAGKSGSAPEQESVAPLIGQMERLGLIEPLPDEGKFRLHDFIRLHLARTVRKRDPDWWQHLQRRAAAYYFNLTQAWDDKIVEATYGSWYKYEDAHWQACEEEWLYLEAQLPDERDVTRSRFTLAFLEAFWWYGCYVEFPFCRQLLDTWEQAALDENDHALLRQLRRFVDNYPPGYQKAAGPHWTEVRRALQRMRDLCGLRGRWLDDQHADVRARTLAFIDIFTTHSWWYQEQLARADKGYEHALEEFGALRDNWVLAWLSFERSDLAAERGDRIRAATYCRQAADTLRITAKTTHDLDEELIANLHRCLADLLWPDDRVAAAREYGRAALHAFLFQSMPNPLGHRANPPDEYTQLFYEEITTRAGERVLEARGDADLPAVLDAMVQPLNGSVTGVAGTGVDAAHVAAALFPEGPLPNELHRSTSDFLDRWGDIEAEFASDALGDLDAIVQLSDQLARADGTT